MCPIHIVPRDAWHKVQQYLNNKAIHYFYAFYIHHGCAWPLNSPFWMCDHAEVFVNPVPLRMETKTEEKKNERK